MRVAFLSDIHGNGFALEPVLADIERQNVDRIVCLGDICFGPQAHECLQLVRELGCPVILGNWDAWSTNGFPPADDPLGVMLYEIGAWWANLLTPEDRAFVETFVPTLDLEVGDGSVMHCFHGSPKSFSDWIFSTTPDADLEPYFAATAAAGAPGAVLRRPRRRRARRRPYAPADGAPLRTAGDRHPRQRRPAVRAMVAEDDSRRAVGGVRDDRRERRVAADRSAARPGRRGGPPRVLSPERYAARAVVGRLVE